MKAPDPENPDSPAPEKSEAQRTTDKLVRQTKAFRARTSAGQLEKLLAEATRWQRKETIARNKLAGVRAEIADLCATLADGQQAQELAALQPQPKDSP